RRAQASGLRPVQRQRLRRADPAAVIVTPAKAGVHTHRPLEYGPRLSPGRDERRGSAHSPGCGFGEGTTALARGRWPLISAPASAGSGTKIRVESAEIRASAKKAGAKSAAATWVSPRAVTIRWSSKAPVPTPTESDSCCCMLAKLVAWLMRSRGISAYISVFREVNWRERKKPLTISNVRMAQCGVVGWNRP